MQTKDSPASTQRPDKGLAGLTLADLVPVPVSQARVAQGLDEGQVLLEALQFAPQVGQLLSCRPSHGLPNLGCLPIPTTPYLHLIPVLRCKLATSRQACPTRNVYWPPGF